MTEFRHGRMETRHDRRLCPRCGQPNGPARRCRTCGARTKPRIRIVWWVNGQRFRELTLTWKADQAREVLSRKEEDYWRQQRLGVDRPVGGTLKDAMVAFTDEKRWHSAEWQVQIGKALHPLAELLGWDQQVHLVSRIDLQRYLTEGLKQRSSSTMRSYMIVVKCFFRWLESEGWIRHDPCTKIRLPPAESRGRKMDFIHPDEMDAFLAACFDVCPDFAPIALAIVLGSFRKGEIINLRHRDLNLIERWALVLDFEGDATAAAWSPKTSSSRRAVPLHPLLCEVLAQVQPVTMPDGLPSPWLFPVTDRRKTRRVTDRHGRCNAAYGDRRSPTTTFFGRKLRQALLAAGIDRRVTVHGLRRTFAVLLQEAGAPAWVIRQAMGHADRGVTEQYYLPRREKVIQHWVDKIDITVPVLPPQPTPIADLPTASCRSHDDGDAKKIRWLLQ